MGGICSIHGEMKMEDRILVGKSEGRKLEHLGDLAVSVNF